jgi:multidrug resistance protein, MATE family
MGLEAKGDRSVPRGSVRELLRLAWPLIVTNSFFTLQIFIDRILLSHASSEAVGASMVAVMLFWAPVALLQWTANYATTFVAQYVGAGQYRRVGPVVWQSLYFSLAGGVLFMVLSPFAGYLVAVGGHTEDLQALEVVYLRWMCFAALPILLSASACSFFAGRGATRVVMIVNLAGLVVNAIAAYVLIFGAFGLPALGIAGAGIATVLGSGVSALVALAVLFRPQNEAKYATLTGFRFEPALFRRLMRFGLPNGLFVALDTLGWTAFVTLVGTLGPVELAATTIAFTLNLIAFLPTVGIGQAVEVLVGQRLGENRPDLAERSAWQGLLVAMVFCAAIVVVYLLLPGPLAGLFQSSGEPETWLQVRPLVQSLLWFVCAYCIFDGMNLVFSFALRGAGDTRFVTYVALSLSWPVMVLPTWAACRLHASLFWPWTFASLYILLLATIYGLRFRQGRWKTMRVIEAKDEATAAAPVAVESSFLVPPSTLP